MLDLFKTQASTKELRPYQINALDMIRTSAGKGIRRIVCQMPTGAGKTVTAARLILSALVKGNDAIFIVPAISLIDQTVAAFEAVGITSIGVMQSNHPRTDPLARVQVASVQTLARRSIPDAALVIVDECHLGFDVLHRLMKERTDACFIGLSATPWAAGMGLHWQDLVIPVTIGELIEAGHLSKFAAFAPNVPDLSGVKIRSGEYVESALEVVMGEAKLMGNVVNTWLERGEDRPTLCFGVNRAHALELSKHFERQGIASAYVDAHTDRIERQVINQRFRDGDVRVICSVRTMTTGVDLPVACIIDAAPTRSAMLHVQKIGRGLRVNPGTEDCIILDHAGNSLRMGLVTDIHHNKLDKTEHGEKQKSNATAEKLPKPCAKCETLHTAKTCPACGHERKPVAGVVSAEGELVEITSRKTAATIAERQRFWSMALWLDGDRNKGGKLARGLYKGRFGDWPRGLKDTPTRPDQAFLRYEKSRRIAYAKQKAKQQGAA